ncbi:MAG: hypothetical protein ACPGO3_13275 [Magnetospiraceae bacterium]
MNSLLSPLEGLWNGVVQGFDTAVDYTDDILATYLSIESAQAFQRWFGDDLADLGYDPTTGEYVGDTTTQSGGGLASWMPVLAIGALAIGAVMLLTRK